MLASRSVLFLMLVSGGSGTELAPECGVEDSVPHDDVRFMQVSYGVRETLSSHAAAVAEGTAPVASAKSAKHLQYAFHGDSVCQGTEISGIGGAPYGEHVTYSVPGFPYVFMGGAHLFHCLALCVNEPACGGMSVDPEGYCTYWTHVDGFSWAASNATNSGWLCLEKTVAPDSHRPSSLDELVDWKRINNAVDRKWAEGLTTIHSAAARFNASQASLVPESWPFWGDVWQLENEHAQALQDLNNRFGWRFLAPITWTLLANATLAIDATHGEECLQQMNRSVDALAVHFEAKLSELSVSSSPIS